jgi:hypothetical protein
MRFHRGEAEMAKRAHAGQRHGNRLVGSLPVADGCEDGCRVREVRVERLRLARPPSALERLLGVGVRALGVVPSQADQAAVAVGGTCAVDPNALLELRDDLLRPRERIVPLARMETVADGRAEFDEPDVTLEPEVPRQTRRLGFAGKRLRDVPMEAVHRGQVVPAAQQLVDEVEPRGELDHFAQLVLPSRVTHLDAPDANGVQRTKTKIVQAEPLGQRERFETELEGHLNPAGEHLVTRTLGQHRCLRPRRRQVLDERARLVEVRLHVLAPPMLPRDVGQQ